ncbi:helix-turn-helix domain-containing protein [Rubrobacter indicoceani]|uniref:helix-turn-helix domain-containing protein n=1 Tax=Rubrobacter indicoceani TaxID=2051957 RepID=UPI000E5B87D7|nr:helix-turn-helix domain-containing protein [Rubrobacter indicoceani]
MREKGTVASETLGSRVRALRRERGMTLEGFSEAAGVSRAMISKVERGEKSPTVSVAGRLAAGLGVSVGRLLGEEEPERRRGVVLRREGQMVMRDPESGFERRLLSGAVEFVGAALPEGSTTGEFPARRTGVVGYLAVERGRLLALLGEEEHLLERGDALTFKADVPHEFGNIGVGEAVYYLVIP